LPSAAGPALPGDSPPVLSVVVASVESAHTLPKALDAARLSCSSVGRHEILVVDASRDDSARIAREHPGCDGVRVHEPGTLVPTLWADGIRASRGRWVALTTGHCVVTPPWAPALVAELERGASVAGSGVRPLPEARALDCAIAFLRYGRYLELTVGSPRDVSDVPGDNAAYPGDRLRKVLGEQEGFWEIDLHDRVREEEGAIRAVPAATAGFGRSFPWGTIARHRLHHARHHGARTARRAGVLRVLLPAPVVPLVLLARSGRLVWPLPELRSSFIRSVPAFLALASVWAAGEAIGAVLGPGPRAGA
jgi:hypothetical protein